MTEWMDNYNRRVNAERLARQAKEVKLAAEDIRSTLIDIERYLYWALDPSEKDGGQYYCQSLLEHAHALIDRAHDYRAALKANPPPKDEDDDAA